MPAKNKNKSRTSSARQRKGRGRRKKGEKPVTEHGRAGLVMPVKRIRKFVKDGRYAPRLSRQAPLYLAAVLEYCVAEVLELAGNCAKDNKKRCIGPRHIMLGIRTDDELGKLCKDVVFPKAGAVPNIHPNLQKKKKKKAKKKTTRGYSSELSQSY